MTGDLPFTAALLEKILDTSAYGVMLCTAVRDSRGNLVNFRPRLFNQVAQQDLPGLREWREGASLWELFPEDTRHGLFTTYAIVCDTRVPFQGEYFSAVTNRWYLSAVMPFDDGVLITGVDITSIKQAEESRQQLAELMEIVVDQSPVGVVLYEAIRSESGEIIDFRFLLTNPANARITGRPVAEMTGRLLSELFPATRQTGLFARLVNVVETGERYRTEFAYNADGVNGWFDGTMMRHGDGVLFTFMEITAHKEQLAALEQRIAELERSDRPA